MTTAEEATTSRTEALERDFTSKLYSAKVRRKYAIALSYLSVLFATATSAATSDFAFAVLAVMMVLSQIAAIALNFLARTAYDAGEERRREHRYLHSLGIEPPTHATLAAAATPATVSLGASSNRGEYFTTTEPEGEGRLIDNLVESAFFTSELAKSEAADWAMASVLLTAVSMLFIWLFPFFWTNEANNSLVQSVEWQIWPSVFVVAAVGPHFETWLAFHQLSKSAEQSFREFGRLQKARANKHSKREWLLKVLFWMSAYDCALAAAWPISDRTWKKRREHLNASWTSRHGRTTPRKQSQDEAH